MTKKSKYRIAIINKKDEIVRAWEPEGEILYIDWPDAKKWTVTAADIITGCGLQLKGRYAKE